MNKKSLTCDDDLLLAMMREELPEDASADVLEHVENCSHCQQRLSDLAAPGEQWMQATVLFSGSTEEPDASPSFDLPPAGQQPIAWTESMAGQLLSPASHPEMLGCLGRYDIERLIGSGGMGVVFKAFDSELNRPVAIKLLAPYLAGSGPARKRFSREARAAAAVVHQHVVPIHNVETEREIPFIVMQFVSGESLQDRIDREGPLELCEILRIGIQVADGLSAAHQQGLVHRDIKPSNILLEEEVDRALISDFGLARAADDASLTRSGFHPGTPQYMSPEQAAGQSIDARSDLFSLGSMLYTMCTGRPPFRAESSLSVMRRIADSEPTAIREINPEIPEWLCSVIGKLMAKSKTERFQSAVEVHELLEECLSHVQQPESIALPAIPAVSRGGLLNDRRTSVLGGFRMKALIVVAGLLGCGMLFPFLQKSEPDRQSEATSESPLMPQFRAADRIRDGRQRDQAFARLAMNAAQAGDLQMTKRALDHVVSVELESPTRRDCAIEMFRNGKHDEAHSLAESIYYGHDRDAAMLAFVQGRQPQAEAAADKQSAEPAKQVSTDAANIQGTWRVAFAEDSGRTGPSEALKDIRIVITSSTLTMEAAGRKNDSTYRLDPSTDPKSIDLTSNGRTKPGIYDLQGDTLRICISENTDARPTAFDSQPNSVNDVVLTMKRMSAEELSESALGKMDHSGPLTAQLARALIPKAASISNEDFQKLQVVPSADAIESKSLSLMLLSLDTSDESELSRRDFQFLTDGILKPSDLAAAMSLSRSKGYVSVIQPQYITDCKVIQVTDQTAEGSVAFNAPLLYVGSVNFEARKHDGTWRIEKLEMPSRKIAVRYGENGMWKSMSAEAGAELDQAGDAGSQPNKPESASEKFDNQKAAGDPQAAFQPDRSLYDMTVNGKHGFIDREGQIVIQPRFQMVYPFSEGLAAVQVDGQWGFIDATGQFVIKPQFIMVAPFSDGRARVRLSEFSDPWGYIDTIGRVVIKPQYDCAEDFRNGIAKVGMQTTKSRLLSSVADVGVECDGQYIDLAGRTVPKPQPQHYSTGEPDELIRFTHNELVGYVDAAGKVIIEPQFVVGSEFRDGLACVCRDDMFGYIDRSGEFVIPARYQYSNDFADGLAGVSLEGNKWGFIDRSGKTVLPAKYDWVYGGFRDGLAKVTVAGRVGYINKQGDWLW